MSIAALLLTYVVVWLAGLAALAVYWEFRRRRFEPTPTADHIFRCTGCGFVYTDDREVERSRCPQCGRSNDAVEF